MGVVPDGYGAQEPANISTVNGTCAPPLVLVLPERDIFPRIVTDRGSGPTRGTIPYALELNVTLSVWPGGSITLPNVVAYSQPTAAPGGLGNDPPPFGD